ncbi:MAG: Crp/Fnr family transcriptional regulator, partial [Chloroflexota bacterium]
MIATDILLLQHAPYFRDLPPEDLALVAGHTRRRTLAAGEIVVLEGQPAEALYLVCGGHVRMFRSTAEGREQVLYMA